MRRREALPNDGKAVIIKESDKCTSLDAIAKKIDRYVDSVRRFQKVPSPRKKRSDAGISKTVTDGDLRNIVQQFRGKPGQSSKSIFTAAGRPDVPKFARNYILGTVASVKAPLKMPSPTPRHKNFLME